MNDNLCILSIKQDTFPLLGPGYRIGPPVVFAPKLESATGLSNESNLKDNSCYSSTGGSLSIKSNIFLSQHNIEFFISVKTLINDKLNRNRCILADL